MNSTDTAGDLTPPWRPGHRCIVTGSRNWPSAYLEAQTWGTPTDLGVTADILVTRVLCEWAARLPADCNRITLVHGACTSGLDATVVETEPDLGCELVLEPHPADWKRCGRGAGPARNLEMARLGADRCEAFLFGTSRGTMSMIQCAMDHGIETWATALWRGGRISRAKVDENVFTEIRRVHG